MANIVGFGEIMLRLATPRGEVLDGARSLNVDFGGAEANTIIALARLGHATEFLTGLPGNDWGRRCAAMLAAAGVQGNARYIDGARIGTYFLESGAGLRGGRVLYDRANSAFARCDWSDIDWPQLLAGRDWLHLSGITLALSESAAQACEDAAIVARQAGCRVSFDCNYREALWTDSAEFGTACRRMVAHADLVFCGCREIRWILNQERPEEISPDPAHGYGMLKDIAPHMNVLAGTLHDHDESGAAKLGGFATNGEESAKLEPHGLGEVVDPVGGGDAFAAGILHGLAEGWGVVKAAEFALAAASLKHTIMGDQLRATPAEVMRYAVNGGAVSR